MTKMTIATLIGYSIVVAVLSFLLVKRIITTQQFLVIAAVWSFLAVLFLSGGKPELFFSLIALIVSLYTFLLLNSPLIVLEDVAVADNGQKLYLYFQNKGPVPAYRIDGFYALTVHQEPSNRKTSDERLLAVGSINASGEAFYPSVSEKDLNFISLPLSLPHSLEESGGHVYFSIKIHYPRLPLGDITLPNIPYFQKGYQGVFVYKDNKWYKSSKTHLPEFFGKVFEAIDKNQPPPFPSTK